MTGARLTLDARKSLATARPIRVIEPPARVLLPINQHSGADAEPLVAVGAHVAIGQPIAAARGHQGGWLHSPISGEVTSIDECEIHSREREPCIRIENDGRGAVHEERPSAPYRSMTPLALIEAIGRGGIVGLGGAAFPTATKLGEALSHERVQLLLNGVECEPYITCDDLLMRERAAEVVAGAEIMMHALTAERCVIAIESDKPQAQAALAAALESERSDRISVVTVPAQYPAGGERQLIQQIYSREVPHRGLPIDVNVICQNVGTAAAVARWILDGVPLIRRILTVTGTAVKEPQNVDAPLGISISSLIEACGGYLGVPEQLIMGGSMMGVSLPSDAAPITKATNCIIAAAAAELNPRGYEMPCIRCGNCSDVCPAALLPQQLHWYARNDDRDALETHGLLDCIECGCCDYVCPSQIPLTHSFRVAKQWLLPLVDATARAHHARTRFEARTARLALEEAERLRQRAELKARNRGI